MHWKPLPILSLLLLTGFATCEKCGPQCANGGHVEEKKYEEQNLKSSCECGIKTTSEKEEPLVINGDIVEPKYKYPWMIALENEKEPWCTASILTSRYVLTAAHCLLIPSHKLMADCFKSKNDEIYCPRPLHELKLRYFKPGGQKEIFMSISSYKFDTRYYSTSPYDIALIRTAEALPCGQFTAPICLPWIGDELYLKNSTAIIAGWGAHIPGIPGPKDKVLREGSLTIWDDETVCKINISATHFCALGKSQNICYGDSGGPLFKEHKGRHYIIGVTKSVADNKCAPGSISFFIKVHTFIPWIKKHMDPKSKLGPYDREIKE